MHADRSRFPSCRPWLLAALVLVAAWLASAHSAAAHESRPAYLDIREVAPGRYELLWRTPVMSGMPLPVGLTLPANARNRAEPVKQFLNDSIVERRSIETEASGLAGERIAFPGLEGTITDVLVRTAWLDGGETTAIIRPSEPWIDLSAEQNAWQVAAAYTKLGTEHILDGVDHLLFVLALILITRGGWKLLTTVTAFTLAHSITLGLATLGFVHVPARPVEAVIALSIVFVAAEVVHGRRGVTGITERAPWIVAFVFGLLHGLGFAGALTEIGLPQGHIPEALLFFNVGVEIGQLLFIAVVLGAFALFRRLRLSLPRWTELVPPYVIGSIGMMWVLQRVLTI